MSNETSCQVLLFAAVPARRDDEHWKHGGHGSAKTSKEKPSYCFKRRCWASCEAGEKRAPLSWNMSARIT